MSIMKQLPPVLTCIIFALTAVSAGGDVRIPIVTNSCSTAIFDAGDAAGLGYNSSLDLLALVDSSDDLVYLFDTECNVSATFPTPSANPTDITHNPTDNMYALTDSSAGEVYFVNEPGNLIGQCDTSSFGANYPTGITYNPGVDLYAITDDTYDADNVYFITDSVMDGTPCNLVSQFSTRVFGSDHPSDIAYLSGLDLYAITDGNDREVYVVDNTGSLIAQFDIYGIGSQNPVGITFRSSTGGVYVVDSYSDLSFEIDASGTGKLLCDTADYGALDPSAVTYNPITDEIVFVDNTNQVIYILDSSCNVSNTLFTNTFGSNEPSGITYIPTTDQLALTDGYDGGIYFIDYTTGSLASQCHPEGLEYNYFSGIDYIPHMHMLTVTDRSREILHVMDFSCKLMNNNSLAVLNSYGPAGMTFHRGAGTFLIAGHSQVDVVNFEGVKERVLSTESLGLSSLTGISEYKGGDQFLVVDSYADEIHVLTLPILNNKPLSLSGQFSLGSSGKMMILERGNGNYSGTYNSNAGTFTSPIYGHFYSDISAAALGAIDKNAGVPRVYTCSVSADLKSISCSGLGTFLREF